MTNEQKGNKPFFMNRLSRLISLHEFGMFLTAAGMLFIALCTYMMFDRYAVLAERYTALEKENAELRTLLNAESLTTGDDAQKLRRYREHLLQKYSR